MFCIWNFCIPFRKKPAEENTKGTNPEVPRQRVGKQPNLEDLRTPTKERHDVEDKHLKDLLAKYDDKSADLKKSEPNMQKNQKPPISKPSGNIGGQQRTQSKVHEKPTDITSQSGIEEKKSERETRILDKMLDETNTMNTQPSTRLYQDTNKEEHIKEISPSKVDLRKKIAPSPAITTPKVEKSTIPKPESVNHKRNVSVPVVDKVDSKKKVVPTLDLDKKSINESSIEQESFTTPNRETPKVNPILKKNPLLAGMQIGGMNVKSFGFTNKSLNNPLLK